MRSYPSIPRGFTGFADKVYVFDKLDGSNIRSEWSPKTGWSKFGSKEVLLDTSNPVLGPAIPLFLTTLAEPLAKIARDQRWGEKLTVFMEFWGLGSFAGAHVPDEPKRLTLFDVCPYRRGMLGPPMFRKLFEDVVPTAKFLGHVNWTPGYVERVWQSDVPGLTFEGVIAKGGEGHKLKMTKAKTKAWIDKVHAVHAERANEIINS